MWVVKARPRIRYIARGGRSVPNKYVLSVSQSNKLDKIVTNNLKTAAETKIIDKLSHLLALLDIT